MGRLPLGDLYDFSSKEVQQLLHNKFVVILGDSIHRTIYKDLVRFLQNEGLLTQKELTIKGAETVCHDHRVEFEGLHNTTDYREVRQYRTDHHLVRVYFITCIFSGYMESILDDFKAGPVPDLLILNSCLWDLNRSFDDSSNQLPLHKAFILYRENLQKLFCKLHDILPTSCLVIWNTAMPVAEKVQTAYLDKGMKNLTTPEDILRANFESAILANCFQFDVLDLNFSFRFFEDHRHWDGTHWNMWVHRCITKLLLTHVANAWGVKLKQKRPQNGIAWNGNASLHCSPQYQPPEPLPHYVRRPPPPQYQPRPPPPPYHPPRDLPCVPFNPSCDPNFQHDSIPDAGFFNFEEDQGLPAHPNGMQYGNFHGPDDYAHGRGPAVPSLFPAGQVPNGDWEFPSHVDYAPHVGQGGFHPLPPRSPRGYRGQHRNSRIMRRERFHREHYRPYYYPLNGAGSHPPYQAPPYVGWRGW